MEMGKKKTVVLYPGLAVSHFVPMMRLADVLLDAGHAVTVALINPTLRQDTAFAAAVARAAASNPSVTFHALPSVPDPPATTYGAQFLLSYFDLVRRHTPHLHAFLRSIPRGGVHALVVDMLSADALGAAAKLGVPAYTFFPSNASALAASVQISSPREEGQPNFGELGDAPLGLRGVPPVPASHLFAELLESPESEVYKSVASMLCRIQEADGILVNSFASLEPRAVAALGDPNCRLTTAPVYCVGPLVAGDGEGAAREQRHECLAWLDEKPERSVVFLCFGGAGSHSAEQIKEIAAGLEKSGRRFLWVARAPPPDEQAVRPSRRTRRPRRVAAGRVRREDQRPRRHRQGVGAAGGRAQSPGDRSVRDALRVELGARGDRGRRADDLLAPVRGAEDEQGVHGGEYGIGVELVGWRDGMVKAGDGVRGRGPAQGAGDGAQGGRGGGVEGRRLVAHSVRQVLVGLELGTFPCSRL